MNFLHFSATSNNIINKYMFEFIGKTVKKINLYLYFYDTIMNGC